MVVLQPFILLLVERVWAGAFSRFFKALGGLRSVRVSFCHTYAWSFVCRPYGLLSAFPTFNQSAPEER